MSVTVSDFGNTKDGKRANLYTLENKNGMVVKVTDYGVNVINVLVPDRKGKKDDVVLGYDTIEGYYVNTCYFGATVGPNANRVANARFTVDGVACQLDVNDGVNNLHSHLDLGYNKVLWKAKIQEGNSILFSIEDKDGNMGFPGNKQVEVTVELTDENELKLIYHVTSDKNTLINMTNHSYFNLAGHQSGSIENHKLHLLASAYTPVAAGLIPTGEIAPVAGTPFDFTMPIAIGAHIDDDDEQLAYGLGYDHNWVVDDFDGSIRKIAEITEETSGRSMEVYTDQPGIQFYAGNCIEPHTGKDGVLYTKRSGMALETQVFPDSVNRENFPDAVYGPERDYNTTTIYKFYW